MKRSRQNQEGQKKKTKVHKVTAIEPKPSKRKIPEVKDAHPEKHPEWEVEAADFDVKQPIQLLLRRFNVDLEEGSEKEREKNPMKRLENRERAFIAASRREDRTLDERLESAVKASLIHFMRTGKRLRINRKAVENEEMYEEEDPKYEALIKSRQEKALLTGVTRALVNLPTPPQSAPFLPNSLSYPQLFASQYQDSCSWTLSQQQPQFSQTISSTIELQSQQQQQQPWPFISPLYYHDYNYHSQNFPQPHMEQSFTVDEYHRRYDLSIPRFPEHVQPVPDMPAQSYDHMHDSTSAPVVGLYPISLPTSFSPNMSIPSTPSCLSTTAPVASWVSASSPTTKPNLSKVLPPTPPLTSSICPQVIAKTSPKLKVESLSTPTLIKSLSAERNTLSKLYPEEEIASFSFIDDWIQFSQ